MNMKQLKTTSLQFVSKTERLEFSKFSGDDPDEWLSKAEQFFEYQGTTPAHKIALASFHMQDEANQ